MQAKMTLKHKLMAYVLHHEFNYTMTAISQLMQVSQSTISTSIKEVNYLITINNLEKELYEARCTIASYGIQLPPTPQLYLEQQ